MLWSEMTEEEINKQCKKFEEDYFSKRSISIYELETFFKFGWFAKDKAGCWGWYPDKPKYNKKKGTWKSDGISLYLNCILKLDEDSVKPECSLIKIKTEEDGY